MIGRFLQRIVRLVREAVGLVQDAMWDLFYYGMPADMPPEWGGEEEGE